MKYKHFATVLLDKNVNKPLDYAIPDHLAEQVVIGSRVLVPVKEQLFRATILQLRQKTHLKQIKPIQEVLLGDNILTKELFQLAEWISNYYVTPLRKVLSAMLPASIKKDTKHKHQLFVERAISKEKLIEYCGEIRSSKPAQAKVLDAILLCPKGILLTELLEKVKVSPSSVQALIKAKVLLANHVQIDRLELLNMEFFPSKHKVLNEEQKVCLDAIEKSIDASEFQTHLLYGVTGSGKTEVYMQAIQKTIDSNKSVVFLIPEIALTSQTIERLKGRFQSKIAILHHRLSDGERFDSWHAMRKGEINIVVGARSAIFSPLQNLGLIIIDEEQESSYKQCDEMPTYHARDVAIMRAKFNNACVILGSATPSLESYRNAKKGKYNLLELTQRAKNAKLPEVELVDLNLEREKKNFSLFSDKLLTKIKKRYEKGEQSLIFLNRRGYYAYLTCKACNETVKCPHCDVSMTFHKGENHLACHICGYQIVPPPRKCPSCKKEETIKYTGAGTEQVERQLKAIFPFLRTIRMDADTTRHKGSHDKLLKAFRSGKADVLIGTQMIAKGLHFPSVTLVGILNADHALNIPDFRSSEMVFQLITQVAGRSGRGPLEGEVIIQSKLLEHPVIQMGQKEDYKNFYELEIESRKLFDYPPFKRLTKVVFSGENESIVREAAKSFHKLLVTKLPNTYSLTHPVPCGYAKIKNRFRYQFIIKGDNPILLSRLLKPLHEEYSKKRNIRILIDVDPLFTFS